MDHASDNHAERTDEICSPARTSHHRRQRLERARFQWLYGEPTSSSPQDERKLQREVELAYQEVWDEIQGSDPNAGSPAEEALMTDDPFSSMVGGRLALLLLQNHHDRWQAADEILQRLGYTCRLSRPILNYSHPSPPSGADRSASLEPPCRVLDHALSASELHCLRRVFLDPNESYWTFHQYCVEPPSPYVSYVIPLPNAGAADSPTASLEEFRQRYGGLGCVILCILDHIRQWKPSVVEQATMCELWAHNRPNSTGHQLHFDSDNEGLETIRHPLLTAILCLSEHGTGPSGGCGAPTLLTTQRMASRQPSDRGWLAFPKANRLVLMDGRVLHGVIPGKRLDPVSYDSSRSSMSGDHSRRVTVMLAFWKRIRVRDEPTPGAARPFPTRESRPQPGWAEALTRAVSSTGSADAGCSAANPEDRGSPACTVDLAPVSHVYDSVLSGRPWTRSMGMPAYDEVFQGI